MTPNLPQGNAFSFLSHMFHKTKDTGNDQPIDKELKTLCEKKWNGWIVVNKKKELEEVGFIGYIMAKCGWRGYTETTEAKKAALKKFLMKNATKIIEEFKNTEDFSTSNPNLTKLTERANEIRKIALRMKLNVELSENTSQNGIDNLMAVYKVLEAQTEQLETKTSENNIARAKVANTPDPIPNVFTDLHASYRPGPAANLETHVDSQPNDPNYQNDQDSEDPELATFNPSASSSFVEGDQSQSPANSFKSATGRLSTEESQPSSPVPVSFASPAQSPDRPSTSSPVASGVQSSDLPSNATDSILRSVKRPKGPPRNPPKRNGNVLQVMRTRGDLSTAPENNNTATSSMNSRQSAPELVANEEQNEPPRSVQPHQKPTTHSGNKYVPPPKAPGVIIVNGKRLPGGVPMLGVNNSDTPVDLHANIAAAVAAAAEKKKSTADANAEEAKKATQVPEWQQKLLAKKQVDTPPNAKPAIPGQQNQKSELEAKLAQQKKKAED